MLSPDDRPAIGSLDRAILTMSAMLDVMGEDGVIPGPREILCTLTYLGDLTNALFKETIANDADFTDFGELNGVATVSQRISFYLLYPSVFKLNGRSVPSQFFRQYYYLICFVKKVSGHCI